MKWYVQLPTCLCGCVLLVLWITFVGFGGYSWAVVSTTKLPDVNGFSQSWSQPLITDIYAVDDNGSCDSDDEPVVEYTWTGTKPMCKGEDIGFNEKREDPSI